jgi:tetratricopeptide (TPR) repeat protein
VGQLEDATIFCGAGISIPSGLPDGQALARVVIDLLFRDSGVFDSRAHDAITEALSWAAQAGEEPQLRLELMLELLARELAPAILVRVFQMFGSATPSPVHLAIALSGARRVVTTNQDLLLEKASRIVGRQRRILHVHGRFDKPATIITLLSQYVEGLPIPTAGALSRAIAGRPVMVFGYSGRDRDVMPLLAAAGSVLWVHHRAPSGSQPDLASEVEVLRSQLGSAFQLIVTDTLGFILGQLPPDDRRRVRRVPAPRSTATHVPPEVRAEFAALPALGRDHAIARVLLHVSAPEIAIEGIRSARRLHGDGAAGRMLEADGLIALNRHKQAIRLLRRAEALAADPVGRGEALLARAHAQANMSDYASARRSLDGARRAVRRLHDHRRRHRFQGQIAALSGRMKGMTDDEGGAMRDYARARRAFREADDLDGLVLATTFGSDMLRSRGRYHEALEQLKEIFADTELYARPSARSWAPFYRGSILGAMGRIKEGLEDLRLAADIGKASGNAQAMAWSRVMLADYLRELDLDEAERELEECARAIRAYGSRMFGCEARLAWERAELARARGDACGARSCLKEIRKMLSSRSVPGPLPYLEAHILAVEGELARDGGDPAAAALVRKALGAYRAGKWAACAARMEVALWLLQGGKPPRALVDRCHRNGYGLEVERLERRNVNPYYPLHTF